MKAEELMQFDWVKLADDNTPKQVDWIRSGEVGLFWNRTVTPPYLEPIPLTAEILEKNGFKLHAISEIYELVSPKKDWFVAIGFKDGCIDWCKVHRWGDEYLGSIKYVHELQHALRLFKVNKEIEL